MRFLSTLLSTALLVAGVVSGKKTSAERFDEFRGLAKSSNPVKLSETKYRALTSTPRDYTAAVLLTAIDARFACALCTEFQPEYDVLAKSWAKGDKNAASRLIFSSLDFMHGRDVFVSLGLQTAPVLLLFPPTEGPHAVPSAEPLRYDFTTGPPTAEQVRSWIARHLPDRPHPEVKRPVDYFKWATTVTVSLGILTAGIVAWPYVQPLLVNRNVWASVSLMAILLFISGHMFNHIRRVPYVVGDGKGGVNYIAGGFQTQYGMETQIVAALYGILAFCAICIAVRVPRVADSRSQKIHVIGWMSAMFIIYGFLMSIFRAKNGSYPFALPPFM